MQSSVEASFQCKSSFSQKHFPSVWTQITHRTSIFHRQGKEIRLFRRHKVVPLGHHFCHQAVAPPLQLKTWRQGSSFHIFMILYIVKKKIQLRRLDFLLASLTGNKLDTFRHKICQHFTCKFIHGVRPQAHQNGLFTRTTKLSFEKLEKKVMQI